MIKIDVLFVNYDFSKAEHLSLMQIELIKIFKEIKDIYRKFPRLIWPLAGLYKSIGEFRLKQEKPTKALYLFKKALSITPFKDDYSL